MIVDGPKVKLLDHTTDPIKMLYMSYRVCYSQLTPGEINERIEDGRISRDKMLEFCQARLATGHVSPLEQVTFQFGIWNVSRAFSHQLVRHRVGWSYEQQSQRYVTYKAGDFPYLVPKSIKESSAYEEYLNLMDWIPAVYDNLIRAGVPAEDARFTLPQATSTNLKVQTNFAALMHMSDLRLCLRAQWEFRRVVALMRAEIVKVEPLLGKMLQPKCGEGRLGHCDEDVDAYLACPLSKVRPHKSGVTNVDQPLGEEQYTAIEQA